MSEAEQSSSDSGLSFERAEFENRAQPALACSFCRQELTDQYWQITRRPACGRCRAQVQSELASSTSRARFFSALRLGALAAVAGCVGWIVISKVTGYEIGIVAIGVGYLVGKAVRQGAGGFGGRRYQIMAVLLTYSAIAFASLPALFAAISEQHHAAQHVAAAQPSLLGYLWAWVLLLSIAFASPFLAGAKNFMGLIIICIGLYEAWKLTRPLPIQVLGPFSVGGAAPAPLIIEADATQ